MNKEHADLLITNAAEVISCDGPAEGLAGDAVRHLDPILNGAVAVRDGKIVEVGNTTELESRYHPKRIFQADGCLISPGLVDPHSHLLYAGSRHDEWEAKVTGRGIAADLQGGIHRSVAWTRAAKDDVLITQARRDLDDMLIHGTTMLEAKTGYGLDHDTELRLLRLTNSIDHFVTVVPTYLGAHVPPKEYLQDTDAYVEMVIDLLPQAAKFAEYCDVCCDPIGFSSDQCRRIATCAIELGLGIRVHADQTGNASGGLLAAELRAASADHVDYTPDEDLTAMAAAGTAAILFPSVTYHLLEMIPLPKYGELEAPPKPFMPQLAERTINSGCVVALSTDYNPGSSPNLSMQTVMQLAARLFRLGYAEIWNMSTLNAAATLGRGHERGSLTPGKRADIIVWRVPEHGMVIHRFGTNLVRDVFIAGKQVIDQARFA